MGQAFRLYIYWKHFLNVFVTFLRIYTFKNLTDIISKVVKDAAYLATFLIAYNNALS